MFTALIIMIMVITNQKQIFYDLLLLRQVKNRKHLNIYKLIQLGRENNEHSSMIC